MIELRDWREAPLEPGTRLLVEASAGTGKTWTIAALYLRLVLERQLPPRRIVVATFTNKAADELRERLRERLRSARALAASDDPPAAPDGSDRAWLVGRWRDEAQRADDRRRLEAALGDFDLAPIGTLHRLADRILREQPFATGAGQRPGHTGDDAELREELARDLRRILLQDPDHELTRLAAALGEVPGLETLDEAVAALLAAGVAVGDDDRTADELLAAPDLPARLRRVLGRREALFNQTAVVARALAALASVVSVEDSFEQIDVGDTLEGLGKLATRTGFRKAAAGDADLEWLEAHGPALVAAVREVALLRPRRRFWRAVGTWVRREARRRLELRGETSFDALLETVHDALAAEDDAASRPLADALHALWPAALVDEFQDTDPIQYGILDRIWRCDQRRPRGWLAIVGDPKQAIYRFRGGDIETYRRARDAATARLALTTNHRSSARFVSACNALFGAGGGLLSVHPDGDIRYEEVRAARAPADLSGLRIDGAQPERPLRIRRIADADDGLKADALVARAIAAAADEIAAMLAPGRCTIDGRPLAPSDLAVLVPGNDHVARTLVALAERGVPAAGSRQASVFETDTARDLLLILEALAEPTEPVQRAALASAVIGGDWEAVRRLAAQPALDAASQASLDRWRDTWQRLGIGAAIRALVVDVAPRVLGTSTGERVLTDLRHLGELLELASADLHGPHALLAWYKRQRRLRGGREADVDARRVRLESDARRVQVMTVHAAKGLEFGIVFLPLAFRHGSNDEWSKAPLVRVPDPASPLGRLDLPVAVRAHAQRLESDERFRLFYVAVTRAIHACVVYDAPAPQQMRDVPLSVLVARHGAASSIDGLEWLEGLPPAASIDALEAVAATRHVRPMPEPARGPRPGRHSFSTLTDAAPYTGGETVAVESAAADEAIADSDPPFEGSPAVAFGPGAGAVDAAIESAHPSLLALGSVGGRGFGNAAHAVLERRVHRRPIAEQLDLVRRMLAEHGAGDGGGVVDVAAFAAMLDRALGVPLWPDGPSVGSLPSRDQRVEFDFVLPLPGLGLAALRQIAAAHGVPDLVPASDREVAGLLRGKIDLVLRHAGRYRALDWKTNRLGLRVDDYLGASLERAMDGGHYRFQALLYTVALDRHLRARLPGYERARHLGDPVYVFVRGAGLAPGAGLWSQSFPPSLLDAVDALLDGRKVAESAA